MKHKKITYILKNSFTHPKTDISKKMIKNIANIPKRVLVVGGVAGGASTAARLRRLNSGIFNI